MRKKRTIEHNKNDEIPPKRTRRTNLRKRNSPDPLTSDEESSRSNSSPREPSPTRIVPGPSSSRIAPTAQVSRSQPLTRQDSSSSDSNEIQNPIHESEKFKKYLRDVRSKALHGSWKEFNWEDKASQTRYVRVASWLRENKPALLQLLYEGAETGYYKCEICARKGLVHIIKACGSNVGKFEIQNVKKHFETKRHKEIQDGKSFIFSSDWKTAMDIKYLKLMAKHRISGKMFKSPEFIEILMSWINEVSNVKIDSETLRKAIPDRTTLQRRLNEMRGEIKGNLLHLINFYSGFITC